MWRQKIKCHRGRRLSNEQIAIAAVLAQAISNYSEDSFCAGWLHDIEYELWERIVVRKPDSYLKLCGQRFWEFISGRKTLYTDIIEPLGSRAKERKEEFEVELAKVTNRLTKEFLDGFCLPDGTIQWKKLVEFNSGIVPPA